jgi:hypothetical protein
VLGLELRNEAIGNDLDGKAHVRAFLVFYGVVIAIRIESTLLVEVCWANRFHAIMDISAIKSLPYTFQQMHSRQHRSNHSI